MTIQIPSNAKKVIEALNGGGYEAFVVGGCVRDALLGNEPHDWDICTDALPEEMLRCFKPWHTIEVGIKHGTVSVELDERAWAYWDTGIHDWFVPGGTYQIQAGRSSRDIVLSVDLNVNGTKQPKPEKITPDTIVMDLMKNPAAMKVFEPFVTKLQEVFGGGETEDSSGGAISDDMQRAMMLYMPVRGMLSFGGGVSYEDFMKMIEMANQQEAGKQ